MSCDISHALLLIVPERFRGKGRCSTDSCYQKKKLVYSINNHLVIKVASRCFNKWDYNECHVLDVPQLRVTIRCADDVIGTHSHNGDQLTKSSKIMFNSHKCVFINPNTTSIPTCHKFIIQYNKKYMDLEYREADNHVVSTWRSPYFCEEYVYIVS